MGFQTHADALAWSRRYASLSFRAALDALSGIAWQIYFGELKLGVIYLELCSWIPRGFEPFPKIHRGFENFITKLFPIFDFLDTPMAFFISNTHHIAADGILHSEVHGMMQISVDSNHSYFCLGNHSAIGLLYKNKAYSGITVYLWHNSFHFPIKPINCFWNITGSLIIEQDCIISRL